MIRTTTHLKDQIDQQRNNKGYIKAVEAGRAKPDGERGLCSVLGVRGPYLTAVVALPNDLVFSVMGGMQVRERNTTRIWFGDEPPLQFHNHQGSANCADDNDKRPEKFANADPDV